MPELKPYTDIKDTPLDNNSLWGLSAIPNLGELSSGAGSKSFRSDSTGMWLGANRFSDAPFSVTMGGVVTLKDNLSTTIIDSTGIVTNAVVGNDVMTKTWSPTTFSDTTTTKLTGTDLEVELRRPTYAQINVDMRAIKNDGALLWVLLVIEQYNYGTSSYDAYLSQSAIQFMTSGALPWSESFSTIVYLDNARGSGLPQNYNMYLNALNSSGSSTLYDAHISYIKLNG